MSDFRPNYLITHDYGGAPKNQDGVFNPYHALVFPDGSKRYRNPANPYGAPAPHAYKLNPQSIGLSYAGQVGSQPTPAAMASLKAEYDAINKQFPGIKQMGHGEAFAQEKYGLPRASKNGRDMIEASWRSQLGGPSQGMGTPTNIDAGLPKNPSFMQYRGANSGSIQAPSLSMPTAPPAFDETPQASNPNAVSNQPKMTDKRGMGGETRIFGGGPGPMPNSPAGGARAASELQDGTNDPAKLGGPAGAKWGFDAGDMQITWADGSTNTLGDRGGGNQPAQRKPATKWGGTPSAGGARQSAGPASMPVVPQAPSNTPQQDPVPKFGGDTAYSQHNDPPTSAVRQAPFPGTQTLPNAQQSFPDGAWPPAMPTPAAQPPTAPHYDAPSAPAFDEYPSAGAQPAPMAAQPVAYQPGRTKSGTAPYRGDKNEQGFDSSLMGDLADPAKAQKMQFDPKQFSGSLDYLKTDVPPQIKPPAPTTASAGWNPFKTLFGG